MPPSIQGSGGRDAAFNVAAALVVGFNLSDEDAYRIIEEWNAGCQPRWSERELRSKLPRSALWLAIGLARFAGLRRSEIEAATGEWIIERDGQAFVDLRDREGEFLTKTGRHYRAVVIDSELARALLAVPKANPIVEPPVIDRHRWFERDLAAWCKPFTGTAKKPLHRLRGLYADDVAKLTEDAVLARLEGIKEASRALGHTTTKTTLNHYLSTTPTPRMQEP